MIIQTCDNGSLDESGGSEKWLDSVCILKVGLKDLMLKLIKRGMGLVNKMKKILMGNSETHFRTD